MISPPLRVLAFVGALLLLGAGLVGFGRISDDPNVSMGLTAAWVALVFVGGAMLGRRRRRLLVPFGLAFAVFTVAAAVWVLVPTLNDKQVNERVVTGAPAGLERADQSPAEGQTAAATPSGEPGAAPTPAAEPPRPRNVQLAAGHFRSIAHPGSGRAAVVKLPGGSRVLTLTRFATDPGPDLRVYLASGDPAGGGELGDFVDLGALKGNRGNQQYELPRGVDLAGHGTVVVWCRAFSVGFTSATLRPS